MTTITSKYGEGTLLKNPVKLAGGAEDEGVGQLHIPGQGGEGGRCRGGDCVAEGEHWECFYSGATQKKPKCSYTNVHPEESMW